MSSYPIGPAFLQVSRMDGWRALFSSRGSASTRAADLESDRAAQIAADVRSLRAAGTSAWAFVGGAAIACAVFLANVGAGRAMP